MLSTLWRAAQSSSHVSRDEGLVRGVYFRLRELPTTETFFGLVTAFSPVKHYAGFSLSYDGITPKAAVISQNKVMSTHKISVGDSLSVNIALPVDPESPNVICTWFHTDSQLACVSIPIITAPPTRLPPPPITAAGHLLIDGIATTRIPHHTWASARVCAANGHHDAFVDAAGPALASACTELIRSTSIAAGTATSPRRGGGPRTAPAPAAARVRVPHRKRPDRKVGREPSPSQPTEDDLAPTPTSGPPAAVSQSHPPPSARPTITAPSTIAAAVATCDDRALQPAIAGAAAAAASVVLRGLVRAADICDVAAATAAWPPRASPEGAAAACGALLAVRPVRWAAAAAAALVDVTDGPSTTAVVTALAAREAMQSASRVNSPTASLTRAPHAGSTARVARPASPAGSVLSCGAPEVAVWAPHDGAAALAGLLAAAVAGDAQRIVVPRALLAPVAAAFVAVWTVLSDDTPTGAAGAVAADASVVPCRCGAVAPCAICDARCLADAAAAVARVLVPAPDADVSAPVPPPAAPAATRRVAVPLPAMTAAVAAVLPPAPPHTPHRRAPSRQRRDSVAIHVRAVAANLSPTSMRAADRIPHDVVVAAQRPPSRVASRPSSPRPPCPSSVPLPPSPPPASPPASALAHVCVDVAALAADAVALASGPTDAYGVAEGDADNSDDDGGDDPPSQWDVLVGLLRDATAAANRGAEPLPSVRRGAHPTFTFVPSQAPPTGSARGKPSNRRTPLRENATPPAPYANVMHMRVPVALHRTQHVLAHHFVPDDALTAGATYATPAAFAGPSGPAGNGVRPDGTVARPETPPAADSRRLPSLVDEDGRPARWVVAVAERELLASRWHAAAAAWDASSPPATPEAQHALMVLADGSVIFDQAPQGPPLEATGRPVTTGPAFITTIEPPTKPPRDGLAALTAVAALADGLRRPPGAAGRAATPTAGTITPPHRNVSAPAMGPAAGGAPQLPATAPLFGVGAPLRARPMGGGNPQPMVMVSVGADTFAVHASPMGVAAVATATSVSAGVASDALAAQRALPSPLRLDALSKRQPTSKRDRIAPVALPRAPFVALQAQPNPVVDVTLRGTVVARLANL